MELNLEEQETLYFTVHLRKQKHSEPVMHLAQIRKPDYTLCFCLYDAQHGDKLTFRTVSGDLGDCGAVRFRDYNIINQISYNLRTSASPPPLEIKTYQ